MDRNRHGIPMYTLGGGPRPNRDVDGGPRFPDRTQTCTWAGCLNRRWAEHPNVPLCASHASIVARLVKPAAIVINNDRIAVSGATEDKPAPAEREGWVYYVQTDGHYKIGFARNVASRMKAYPPTSVLLAQHRGTMADERAIHQRFAAHRVAGREWFRMDPEITAYIDGVIAIHGRCVDPFAQRMADRPEPVRLRGKSRRSNTRVI